MIKALLFDFDGLLMDTESPEVEIWQEIYASHQAVFPLETWIHRVVGSTDANFDAAANLAAIARVGVDVEALRQRARLLRLEKQSHLGALPGVRSILSAAARLGLRPAIVSSSPHGWVDGYLDQLAIRPHFEQVICREDAPRLKPQPDLYLEAMRRLDLSPAECLAFEDSPNGVLAAHRAGLRVVGVPNPVTVQAGPLPADLVLTSLIDLPLEALLERFNS